MIAFPTTEHRHRHCSITPAYACARSCAQPKPHRQHDHRQAPRGSWLCRSITTKIAKDGRADMPSHLLCAARTAMHSGLAMRRPRAVFAATTSLPHTGSSNHACLGTAVPWQLVRITAERQFPTDAPSVSSPTRPCALRLRHNSGAVWPHSVVCLQGLIAGAAPYCAVSFSVLMPAAAAAMQQKRTIRRVMPPAMSPAISGPALARLSTEGIG